MQVSPLYHQGNTTARISVPHNKPGELDGMTQCSQVGSKKILQTHARSQTQLNHKMEELGLAMQLRIKDAWPSS